MSFDIVLYIVVTIVLLARLWSLFGRRNDEDQERQNPFGSSRPEEEEMLQPAGRPASTAELPQLLKPFVAAPASLIGGLEQVKAIDPTFDEKQFLQGAKQAFTMIVGDFAKGEMGNITRLLGPKVLPHFEKAVEARRAAGHVMENKITSVSDVETVAARTEGTQAFITVRFISSQENVLRDAGGKIVGGAEGVEEITDVWVFSRDMRNFDPNWVVVETKS